MVNLALDIRQTTAIPDFLPAHLRAACSGQVVEFSFHRSLKKAMEVPEDISISDYAEKYRRVTPIDAHPGPWRNELIPHAKKIMDLIGLPSVRTVCLCMTERGGKTNILLNTAMYKIDRGFESGNVFWLMPSEEKAKEEVGDRIIPVLKASPRSARLLSSYADDTTRKKIKFKNGTGLKPAWAGSPGSVAGWFGKLNIADEIDKMDTKGVGKETDILTLFEKRGRDDDSSMLIYASTPAQGFIYKKTMACQQVWSRTAKCPHCDEQIRMSPDGFVIPADAREEDIKNGTVKLAYSCNACGADWDEQDRKSSYVNGRDVAIKGGEISAPVSIGYHLPAWYLPQIKMSEICAAKAKAEIGDTAAKIAWANGYAVENYDPPKAAADHKVLLSLCDDRPRDLVPTGSACLALQVDTQQSGFYYELAAIAYGDAGTSHLVSKGFLLNFADLLTLSARTWTDAEQREYRIQSALIDSGGTRKAGMPPKHSRTKEVYEFCKANPMFIPVKGTGRKDTPVKYTTLDRWPGTSKPIPGGLILVTLDVHYFKDELARRIAINPEDPGAFVLYSGYTQGQLEQQQKGSLLLANDLEDYAKHLCAEYRNELGIWEHDKSAGRNDYADCATYRMYHIELLKQQGRLNMPREIQPEQKTKPENNPAQQPQNRKSRRW